ncbi:MAG: group III truncated hemoglobin [Proteobacteria bacterium]|nr:group III truncated hemoglobin [Pseudomonadota bacterium]
MRQPHPNAPGMALEVDENLIRAIVDDFYGNIRMDDRLGPIFNAVVQDWDEHLHRLRQFWSSVVLLTGSYKGAPLQAHLAMPELEAVHFERWLELFEKTLWRFCTASQVTLFMDRAKRISQSFQMGLAQQRGGIPFR